MHNHLRICTSCGDPFESSIEDQSRCFCCRPHAGWASPPKQHIEDADGFGTREDIARKQLEERGE